MNKIYKKHKHENMNTNSEFYCKINLPSNYRIQSFLDFQRKDQQMIAERVDNTAVEKGIFIENHPACLIINFASDYAEAALLIDGKTIHFAEEKLISLVKKMLGISQNVEIFEKKYIDHPNLHRLITINSGLRIVGSSSPYEAFTRAIFSQQISLNVAISIRRKFIKQFGAEHSSGIMCYPEAQHVAHATEEQLKSIGCSLSKARTILEVSNMIVNNELPLNTWLEATNPEEIRNTLLDIKGIGPWTADSVLIRGYGCLDSSLHNDLKVRKQIQTLLKLPNIPHPKIAESWLSQFTPWRTLVAAHLWEMQD